MKKIMIWISLAAFAQSCSGFKTLNYAPVSTPTTQVLTQPTQYVPAIDTVVTDTSDVGKFRITDLDPENRVVAMSALELSVTTHAFVFDSTNEEFLLLSDNSQNEVYNIDPKAKFHLEAVKLSPDRKHFAYLEIESGFNIWISKVDGSSHSEIQKSSIGSSYYWLNNDQLVVYNNSGTWLDCPSDVQVVSLTGDPVISIPAAVSTGNSFCFPTPVFNPDFSKGIYLDSKKGWQVYDYRSGTSQGVLSGLDVSPDINKYFFRWDRDGLSFAIPESHEITFDQNLTEQDLTASTPSFQVLALPEHTLNENAVFDFWVPEKQIAGFDLVGEGEGMVLNCDVHRTFVLVDLLNEELRNYCLDRTVFIDQTGSIWSTSISTDNRFVGWTIRELPSNERPLGTVILNTDTGEITYLPGYEFLGFGEVDK